MKKEYEGYYGFLKKEINKFKGDVDDYIYYLPDLFKLLCDLLNTKLKKNHRMKVACALGYFVAPEDVIPEEIYGPAGYIDDIFLCCYVLKDIQAEYGIGYLRTLWDYDEDIENVLNYAYKESYQVIKKKKLKNVILKYIGLQ